MYLLLPISHFTNGAHRLTLLSSHNVLIAFSDILRADIVVWCLLGQLQSCIILKVVSVSTAYF